jgi:copper chaperone NosL
MSHPKAKIQKSMRWDLGAGILDLTTIAALSLLTVSCSAKADGPPEIVVDRTACSHCTMLISEVSYAAAYQAPGADARVFDDIGCLLEAMRREGLQAERSGLRVWVRDGGDGNWLDEGSAVFVVSSEIRTPMGDGIVAYRDAARAKQMADQHRGRVARSVIELMNGKGEQ